MAIKFKIEPATDREWVDRASDQIAAYGFAIIGGVASPTEIETYRAAVHRLPEKIMAAVGRDRFEASRMAGYEELRLPFIFEPVLYDFLANPHLLAVIDRILGPSATLRFYNAGVTPPTNDTTLPRNTDSYHQNFKVFMNGENGKPLLLDVILALIEPDTSIRVVPASHTIARRPTEAFLESNSITLEMQIGDILVMTPFLWHCQEANRRDHAVASASLQFSRPFIKPHADYMRAIDAETRSRLPERTRQMLGAYTQLPVSPIDFYLPEQQRPYRSGQW